MRKIMVLGVAATFLAGCGPDIYYKDGISQAEFNQDLGSCQMFVAGVPLAQAPYVPPTYTATTTGSMTYNQVGSFGYGRGYSQTTITPDYSGQAGANLGTALGNAIRQRDVMRACMASKGYSRDPNEAAQANYSPSAMTKPTYTVTADPYQTRMRHIEAFNRCISGHINDPGACGPAPN